VTERFDPDRMEALSDGVFAIAITLLVLEISVPEEDFHHLGRAILDQWPSYLAYLTSFLTIGSAWFWHHGLFRRMSHADHTVARLNLLLLMVVAFLPFPTRLLAEGIEHVEAERAAVLFYGGVLVVMLLLLAAMCRYVAARPQLVHEEARPADLERLAATLTPGLAFYVALFGVAVVAPRAAPFGFLAVAALAVLSRRGEEVA
jgi:uncharacterized membrane protein